MPNGASSTSYKKTGGGSKKVSTASPSTSSSSRRVSGGGSKGGRKGGANTRPTQKNVLAKGGLFGLGNLGKKRVLTDKERSNLEILQGAKDEVEKDKKNRMENIRGRMSETIQGEPPVTRADKMKLKLYDAKQTFKQNYGKAKTVAKQKYGEAKNTYKAYKDNTNSSKIAGLTKRVEDLEKTCCPKELKQSPTSPGSPAGGRRK